MTRCFLAPAPPACGFVALPVAAVPCHRLDARPVAHTAPASVASDAVLLPVVATLRDAHGGLNSWPQPSSHVWNPTQDPETRCSRPDASLLPHPAPARPVPSMTPAGASLLSPPVVALLAARSVDVNKANTAPVPQPGHTTSTNICGPPRQMNRLFELSLGPDSWCVVAVAASVVRNPAGIVEPACTTLLPLPRPRHRPPWWQQNTLRRRLVPTPLALVTRLLLQLRQVVRTPTHLMRTSRILAPRPVPRNKPHSQPPRSPVLGNSATLPYRLGRSSYLMRNSSAARRLSPRKRDQP
jgi:hypothetical protein